VSAPLTRGAQRIESRVGLGQVGEAASGHVRRRQEAARLERRACCSHLVKVGQVLFHHVDEAARALRERRSLARRRSVVHPWKQRKLARLALRQRLRW